MKGKQIDYGEALIWICIGTIVGMVSGMYLAYVAEDNQMGSYDLYNCIYNNAQWNDFNNNPIMIEKIQNECICFREHNYTNLLEVDCSREVMIPEKIVNNISCHSDGCNDICCNSVGTCTTTLRYCSEESLDSEWGVWK